MIPKIAHFHWTHRPMDFMRRATIATFEKHNPDWEVRIIRTSDAVSKLKLKSPAHQGDCTRWNVLADDGGWIFGSDIVFVKGISDEWLDCDMAACTNGSERIWHMAAIGAVPGLEFFQECAGRVAEIFLQGDLAYQSFGVYLLKRVSGRRHISEHFDRFTDIPMDAFCPVTCTGAGELSKECDIELPDNCVGVHWYGAAVDPTPESYIWKLAVKELES